MADPNPLSRWSRVPQMVLVAVLALGLGLPGVASVVHPSHMRDFAVENRRFAPLPDAPRTLQAVFAYPGRFDASFNDRFGLRPTLIRWHNFVLLRGLGLSPTPQVVLGDDGWLFEGGPRVLAYHLARAPFAPDVLAAWHAALEGRRRWLAQQGAQYLLVLVPDKQTIYPEHLPARLRGQGATRLDALLGAFAGDPDSPLLDLRPALIRAKGSGLLYQRTDTHWNDLGAYLGYRAILARLAPAWPGLTPLPPEGFALLNEPGRGGDLARMLGHAEWFPEDRLRMAPRRPPLARPVAVRFAGRLRLERRGGTVLQATERPAGTIPRLLVIHNSFGDFLRPFLSEHAGRALYMRDGGFDPALILAEQPQVVLQVMSERTLMTPVPRDDPLFFGLGGRLSPASLERFKVLLTAPPAVAPPAPRQRAAPREHAPRRRASRP